MFWFSVSSASASTQYVNAEFLNVRTPSLWKGRVIAILSKWQTVEVLGDATRWWKKILLSDGREWYVNKSYIQKIEPNIKKADGARYRVSVRNAYMRDKSLYSKVAVLNETDVLEVQEHNLMYWKWLKVKVISTKTWKYIGRVGYIYKKLVAVDEWAWAFTANIPNSSSDNNKKDEVKNVPVWPSWITTWGWGGPSSDEDIDVDLDLDFDLDFDEEWDSNESTDSESSDDWDEDLEDVDIDDLFNF